MIEHISKTSKKNNQTLNIAWHEISAILNINDTNAIAREKFNLLTKHCFDVLWINKKDTLAYKRYNGVMNHYFMNGANYFLFFNYWPQEDHDDCKKNYTLFRSVIERIDSLTKKQRDDFLQGMKAHCDTPRKMTDETENPIITMDHILSAVISK